MYRRLEVLIIVFRSAPETVTEEYPTRTDH